MHLVITTRSDPPLHLARLRDRGQLTELRSSDLRFTSDETAEFPNRVMGLALSEEDVAILAFRTEGWITGLQMAAISMQGRDAERITDFIRAFTGSNRYVLAYLIEEVLDPQPQGSTALNRGRVKTPHQRARRAQPVGPGSIPTTSWRVRNPPYLPSTV